MRSRNPAADSEYVSCPDVNGCDAFAARVHGDSMTPDFHEGDIVIFSPTADRREGDACLVKLANGWTTFKRVFPQLDEQGRRIVRLQPINSTYAATTILAETVENIYPAVFKYTRVNDR